MPITPTGEEGTKQKELRLVELRNIGSESPAWQVQGTGASRDRAFMSKFSQMWGSRRGGLKSSLFTPDDIDLC